jgi:hypothetical protein
MDEGTGEACSDGTSCRRNTGAPQPDAPTLFARGCSRSTRRRPGTIADSTASEAGVSWARAIRSRSQAFSSAGGMADNALPAAAERGTTMDGKALASIVVACTLVAGCAGMHPRPPREAKLQHCQGSAACAVEVKVECERFFGCDLDVDYDLVLVEERGKRVDIVWRLSGDTGARFPASGVVLDSTEFECGPRADGREFACTDKHSDFGVFKYRINVTVPQSLFGPRGVPSLDPWIVNR